MAATLHSKATPYLFYLVLPFALFLCVMLWSCVGCLYTSVRDEEVGAILESLESAGAALDTSCQIATRHINIAPPVLQKMLASVNMMNSALESMIEAKSMLADLPDLDEVS
jgi:hypothetical protein